MAATLISDDGRIAKYMGEDGFTYEVASQFAPPSLGGMGAPAQQPAAPPEAYAPPAPAPEAELNFPPDVLSQPQPDPGLAGPGAAFQAPQAPPAQAGAAPAVPEPVAVPVEEPVLEMPPDEIGAVEAPQIAPTGPLNKPTEVATAVNDAAQTQADSAATVANAKIAGGQQIIDASTDAQYQLDEYQKQRDAELQQRQADEAELQEKHKKLVDRYANFKVDPNRGMSTERQAMAWIGAAIAAAGQVVAGKDPSQNPVIPLIFAQMDRRVQEQMAERDGLGNAIGMSKEGIADFRAATKTRLGEYDLRMAAALERAAKVADNVKVWLGSIQEREAATQTAAALRAEAATRMGSANAAEAEARAKARAAVAAARAAQQRAMEKAQKDARDQALTEAKAGLRYDPATGTYVRDESLVDPKERLAIEGNLLDNEKKRRDLAGQGPDTEGSVARVKDNAARSVNGFDGKPLMRIEVQKDASGKDVEVAVPVRAKTEKEAQELRTSGAAVDSLLRASQLLRIAIKNHGGSSSLIGSAEYQQAQSLLSSIDMENKDVLGLGVIQGADMKILEGVRGGADPTSFIKDASPGLEAMEKRAVEKYNAKLRQVTDYADTKKGGGVLEPTKLSAAVVSEQRPDERVRTFTKGDPSVAGDDQAIAKDREMRLAAVDTFLKRDKPSPESIEAAMRAVNADTHMPAGTKAQVLAKLADAKAKNDSPEAKAARELEGLSPRRQVRVVPENLLFNLPQGSK